MWVWVVVIQAVETTLWYYVKFCYVFKSKTAKINLEELVRKFLLAMKCTLWYIVTVHDLMYSNRSFKNVTQGQCMH